MARTQKRYQTLLGYSTARASGEHPNPTIDTVASSIEKQRVHGVPIRIA
jgi:hypothetical protein